MHNSVVIYLALTSAIICIVQSANPTGGTGCSARWFWVHWCWRYCDGTAQHWCYTRSGCQGREESCATETMCRGWCKDYQIAEGCVADCPDRNRGQETTCTPTDSLETVQTCDNLHNPYPTTCTYSYMSGIGRENKDRWGGSTSATTSHTMEAGGGIDIKGLSATFKYTLGISRTTENNWGSEMASTYNLQTTHTVTNNVPGNKRVNVKQIIGRCGDFIVYGRIKMVEE